MAATSVLRSDQVPALTGTALVALALAFPARVSGGGFSTGFSVLPVSRFLATTLFVLLVADCATPFSDAPAHERAATLRGIGICGALLSAAVLVLVTLDDGYRPGAGLWLSLAGTLLVVVVETIRHRRR